MAYSSTPAWRATTSTTTRRKNHLQQYKRRRLTIFSLDPSRCSDPQSTSIVKGSKKPLQDAKILNGCSLAADSDEFTLRFGSDDDDDDDDGGKRLAEGECVEWIWEVTLWRKILFASKKVRSILLLIVITIVYASDISVIKAVEAVMDPAAFSAVRFVDSAIPFLPFVFQARDDVETRNAGIELGLWIGLGYIVEALGLLTSDAGRESFISFFTVILVPLLDGMLGVIIPARTWFGVLMSAIGVLMLECSGSPPSVGDLLNFLSAIFLEFICSELNIFQEVQRKRNSCLFLDTRSALLLCCPQFGLSLEVASMVYEKSINHCGNGRFFGNGFLHFRGYLLFIPAYSLPDCAYEWRLLPYVMFLRQKQP